MTVFHFRTGNLLDTRLKQFRDLSDIGNENLRRLLSKGEVLMAADGQKLTQCFYNDPRAIFLLQGSISFKAGMMGKTIISADSIEAARMINEQLPEGGAIYADSDDAAIFIVKRTVIQDSRVWSNKPLPIQASEFGLFEGGDHHLVLGQENEDWMSRLLTSPLFSNMSPARLQLLFRYFEHQPVNEGQMIVKKGRHDQRFFVIKSGRAFVLLDEKQETRDIVLKPGDFFGEGAVVGNTVHTATVIMETDGELCHIGKEHFDELLKIPLLSYIGEKELEELLKPEGPETLLVDVRMKVEYEHDHVEGSINIPIRKLRDHLAGDLCKDVTYVILHCEDKRSELAALLFIEYGFTAYLYRDGGSVV